MSQAASEQEHSAAVRRLHILVSDLRRLCEDRSRMEQVVSEDPHQLWNLLNLVSAALYDISMETSDEALAAAARKRQLLFDRVADVVIARMRKKYRKSDQLSKAWADNRFELRQELDTLWRWVSVLPITLLAIWALSASNSETHNLAATRENSDSRT